MKITPAPTAQPRKRATRARRGEGSLKMRGANWWYIIPNPQGGARIERSCDTANYSDALLIKNKALIAAHSPRAVVMATTVNDVLDRYEKYCRKERQRSWRSLQVAIHHLRTAFAPIIADNMTTADTDQFRDDRMAEDQVTDSTVNRELGYLRAALRREMKTTPPLVTRIPYMRTPSEKDCVREGFIYREDYERILPQLPASLRPIFVCAFHTGARSGELKMIEWRQVRFEQSMIELRPKTTKNRDGRWIPIWGDMREYLLEAKAIRDRDFPLCPWVFFWQNEHAPRAIPGERLKDFRFAWDATVSRAGYPELLFHDLRRSAIKFADQEADISPRLVRLMSGHKTESVYIRYNIGDGRDISRMARDLDAHMKTRASKVVEMRSA